MKVLFNDYFSLLGKFETSHFMCTRNSKFNIMYVIARCKYWKITKVDGVINSMAAITYIMFKMKFLVHIK